MWHIARNRRNLSLCCPISRNESLTLFHAWTKRVKHIINWCHLLGTQIIHLSSQMVLKECCVIFTHKQPQKSRKFQHFSWNSKLKSCSGLWIYGSTLMAPLILYYWIQLLMMTAIWWPTYQWWSCQGWRENCQSEYFSSWQAKNPSSKTMQSSRGVQMCVKVLCGKNNWFFGHKKVPLVGLINTGLTTTYVKFQKLHTKYSGLFPVCLLFKDLILHKRH